MPHPPGLCLKGRGAIGAVPERVQSGHRGCESGWGVGGFWRLGMRLWLVLGCGNASGVESGQWGRGGGGCYPPLPATTCPQPGSGAEPPQALQCAAPQALPPLALSDPSAAGSPYARPMFGPLTSPSSASHRRPHPGPPAPEGQSPRAAPYYSPSGRHSLAPSPQQPASPQSPYAGKAAGPPSLPYATAHSPPPLPRTDSMALSPSQIYGPEDAELVTAHVYCPEALANVKPIYKHSPGAPQSQKRYDGGGGVGAGMAVHRRRRVTPPPPKNTGQPPPPPPQTNGGKTWGKRNFSAPFLVHNLLDPRPLPPPGMHWKGGRPPPPPQFCKAPSLCPATVSLTPSGRLNGIFNRQ